MMGQGQGGGTTDFKQDMKGLKQKLEKNNNIIRNKSKFRQKLINSSNEAVYILDKKMLIKYQEDNMLTSEKQVRELRNTWKEKLHKDEDKKGKRKNYECKREK